MWNIFLNPRLLLCACRRHFSWDYWGRHSRTQRCHSSTHPTLGGHHRSPFQWQTGSSVPHTDPSLVPAHLPTHRPCSPLWSPWLPVSLQQVQPGVPHSGEAPAALAVPCHEGGNRVPPLLQTLSQSGGSAEAHAEHTFTAGQCTGAEHTLHTASYCSNTSGAEYEFSSARH